MGTSVKWVSREVEASSAQDLAWDGEVRFSRLTVEPRQFGLEDREGW
jgi:hypothetical protein